MKPYTGKWLSQTMADRYNEEWYAKIMAKVALRGPNFYKHKPERNAEMLRKHRAGVSIAALAREYGLSWGSAQSALTSARRKER